MPTHWQQAEKEFESIWKRFGKRAHCLKLVDAAEIAGRTKRTGRAVRKQPSDFIVTFDGETAYSEVKSSDDKTAFRFSMLQDGQKAHATMILAAGGKYYVYVRSTVLGKWFRIPYEVIKNHVRESIKWSELGNLEWNALT